MALVLAVLLAFLAVDQATALHGNVPHWPVFYLPVLVTTFGCLVALTPGHQRPASGRRQPRAAHLLLPAARAGRAPPEHSRVASPAGWASRVLAIVKHGTEVAAGC